MTLAYVNRIGTAVPAHDMHAPFVTFADTLLMDDRSRSLFGRMAERSGIAHRYSHLRPGILEAGEVDAEGFYQRGRFPGTAARMVAYETQALALAAQAAAALDADWSSVTHLVVASCTGFTAPGLDLQLTGALGLPPDVRRTMVGFMGCAAAIPALRIASEAVRADRSARVLVINVEISSLHLQETQNLQTALAFLLFADGASAALVSADPGGIALGDFRSAVIPDSADLITWRIGDQGFEMHLSGQVPMRIAQTLRADLKAASPAGLLRGEGRDVAEIWAVHAGGRSVLDAVQAAVGLAPSALAASRGVLHDYGNMSSSTVMFVLERLMRTKTDAPGIAIAFGPGTVAETMRFRVAE